MNRALMVLAFVVLSACAVKHHVHYSEDSETRPDRRLIDKCPCEFPWAPRLDPCCLPQGLQKVAR